MDKPSDYTALTANLLGLCFLQVANGCNEDDGCFVLLTKELADHLAEMYMATDWNDLELDENSIQLPDEVFGDTVNTKELYRHIGECIYVSCYGESWDELESATAFSNGVVIDFSEHPLNACLDILHDLLIADARADYIWELNRAVSMLMKSGLSEEEITRRFKKAMRKFNWK